MKIIIENPGYEDTLFHAVEGESVEAVEKELKEAVESSDTPYTIEFRGRHIICDFLNSLTVYSLDEFWEKHR